MTKLILTTTIAAIAATSSAFAASGPSTHNYRALYQQSESLQQPNFGGMPRLSRVQVYVVGQGLQWKTIESPKSND